MTKVKTVADTKRQAQMLERYRALRGQHWSTRLAATLPSAATSLVSWMEQHTCLIKRDSYSRVGLFEVDGCGCFLKLYLPKSALQKAGFHLHIARGLRAFDAGCALRQAGLAIPEMRACLLVSEGVLLMTEALVGGRDLREIALAEFDDKPAVNYLTMAAEALSDLHREGYQHGDCKWSNLLLSRGRIYFVDLERTKKLRGKADVHTLLHRKQLVDVARFTADAERFGIDADDFATFVTHYCRGIDCDSESLLQAVRPHLESTRQRHLQRYGAVSANTLL